MNMIKWLLIFIVFLLAACAPTTLDKQYKGMTSEQIYQAGERALAKGRYEEASKHLSALENLYPFGPYAEQGQLDLIYDYYKNGDTGEALAAADRYIHLYPSSPNIDYAFYLRGLINFERGGNWVRRAFNVSPSKNDLNYLRDAFTDFNQLVQRYPRSKYAADARKRMIYIRNVLAQNELDIAQFYYNRRSYVAAANRASYIVKHYEGAPQVISALDIMVRSYRALGLDKPANDALGVLRISYPDSREYQNLIKSY